MDVRAIGKTIACNGKKVEASNRSRMAEHLKNRYGADNSKMRNSYKMRANEAGSKISDSKIQCYGCGMFGYKAIRPTVVPQSTKMFEMRWRELQLLVVCHRVMAETICEEEDSMTMRN